MVIPKEPSALCWSLGLIEALVYELRQPHVSTRDCHHTLLLFLDLAIIV